MALQEEFEKQGIWLFRYRGSIPLIIFIIGFALFIYSELFPEQFPVKTWVPTLVLQLVALAVSFTGLFIRVYTVGHTPRNTSGRNVGKQVAESLNTTGIYSMVRHPLYVGNFFMWLGPALMTGSPLFIAAFILFYWVYYERIMFAEEQFLRGKFQQVYLDWSANVPAFVPSFRNFKKPSLPFSWKKVVKKEKNGLAAIFLIFYAFDVCVKLIRHDENFFGWLFYATLASLIFYLVFKLLKKKKFLQEEGR
ncbi:MAG: isoprenylcysteine carboxylmethyltransferase family protein [Bacteroidales bacterium]|nr:isoprenylcysteine carboxylmethyltransferase family protein [Bacteroidales bacterium]